MSSIVPADASPGEARELPVDSFSWVLALFGTAVGAGILFLPIQVEQSGFWVLLLVSVLIYPTIYLGHRFYALIPSRVADGADFFAAVGRWLPGWGAILLHLLFISWLLILLIAYSISGTSDPLPEGIVLRNSPVIGKERFQDKVAMTWNGCGTVFRGCWTGTLLMPIHIWPAEVMVLNRYD